MERKNILLIQTAFIGDVVLTTPMIAAVKFFFPDSRLTVMIKPEAKAILENNPCVNNIIIIDKAKRHKGLIGMKKIIREVRAKRFDILLSPHQSHRSSMIALFSKIPERHGYETAAMANLSYTHLHHRNNNSPEIIRLLTLLSGAMGCNVEKFSLALSMYETEKSKAEVATLVQKYGIKKPILIAPSSVWETKRWTPHGFAELIGMILNRYPFPVMLVGSPQDRSVSRDVMNYVRFLLTPAQAGRVFDVCGETSISGLYSLMLKSSLLISNDSAPVHFGCAAGIPVVALFGATTPSLGYAPITPDSRVASIDIECRPCGTHGGRECPLGHFRCMNDLEAEDVFKRILEVMPLSP